MRIITIIEKLKRNEQGNNLFVVFIENEECLKRGEFGLDSDCIGEWRLGSRIKGTKRGRAKLEWRHSTV